MFLKIGGHGDSIAQASKIRIVTECPLPMQVDGEPVMLQSCEISIDKKNQALMVLADETSTSTIRALASMSCNYFFLSYLSFYFISKVFKPVCVVLQFVDSLYFDPFD